MWWWGETEAVGIQQWVDDTIAMFKDQLGGEIDPTLVDTDAVIPGFTEAAAAGQPADVQFLFNGIYHMENVWLGYLDPLDGLISAETVAEGGGTAMSVYEGKTYRTGFYAIGFGVMYNKELFTQAGLDPEAPPQTWDEFLAACEALKAKDIVPMGAGVSDGYFGEWYFVNSLTQNLDSPADALNLFIGELDWNDPKYHEHWVKLREMKDKGYFNDDVSSLALYQGLNLFDTGKAAMAINTTPALPNTLSKLGAEKVGYIVLPTFGTGAMAGKPITDTQGFGIPVQGGREGDRRRLHRLHALAGAPAGDVDDVEADPGRHAVRCRPSSTTRSSRPSTTRGSRRSPNVYIADLMPGVFWTDAMFVCAQKILAGEMTGDEAGALCAEVTQKWKDQNPDMVANYTTWGTDLASA